MTDQERIARLEQAVALLIDQVGRTEFSESLQNIANEIRGLPPVEVEA